MDVNTFDAERPRLMALATRILGSKTDADDVLQEAWLRLTRSDDVDNVPAWLTTVVTRLCLDHLRKGRTRVSVETRLSGELASSDPEADALLGEAIGDALHVIVTSLAPAERVAFVLHDIFDIPFDEISTIMGRSDTAVRQLASRGRRKAQGTPEPVGPQGVSAENQLVVAAFLDAARGGDMSTLLTLLAPDAVMRADHVAQHLGTNAEYQSASAVATRFVGNRGALPAIIDGELGAAWIHAGSLKVAFIFHVEARHIYEVELIADPEILATLNVERVRRSPRRTTTR